MTNGCSSDEYCNQFTRQCERGCQSHENCAPDEFCDYGECHKGCRDDETCGVNQICNSFNGTCQVGCRVDFQCEQNEYCDHGSLKCKIGCRTNNDCESSHYCEFRTRICKPGCRSDRQCRTDQYCNVKNHKCVDICRNTSCGIYSKCTAHNHVQYCSCLEKYFPQSGNGCRPKTDDDDFTDLNCSAYCAKDAKCKFENGNVFCYCSSSNNPLANPFKTCYPSERRLHSSCVSVG